MIVTRALYGLKSSGAAFRAFLATRLDEIGFVPSEADPDVWMRRAVKPDGEHYYEYILCYVDDIMSVSNDPIRPLKQIQEKFKFKKDKMVPPDIYLGGNIEKKLINDHDAWTLCSRDYVKAAVETITTAAEKRGLESAINQKYLCMPLTILNWTCQRNYKGKILLYTKRSLGS